MCLKTKKQLESLMVQYHMNNCFLSCLAHQTDTQGWGYGLGARGQHTQNQTYTTAGTHRYTVIHTLLSFIHLITEDLLEFISWK